MLRHLWKQISVGRDLGRLEEAARSHGWCWRLNPTAAASYEYWIVEVWKKDSPRKRTPFTAPSLRGVVHKAADWVETKIEEQERIDYECD